MGHCTTSCICKKKVSKHHREGCGKKQAHQKKLYARQRFAMTIKETIDKNRWVVISILLFLLLGIQKLEGRQDAQSTFDRILSLQNQNEQYHLSIDELGAEKARQEVLLIESDERYAQLLSDFRELEKTKSQTRVVTTTSIDSIYVPVHTTDTIYLNDKWMPVYSFRDSSDFYTIAGRVSPESALLEKISFPNTITFSQRWERKKLLSKKTYFVEVENTNPYVQIQGVQNYEIKDESWFWEKNKFWFAIGAGAGILISK
jgi:hypothetical protein